MDGLPQNFAQGKQLDSTWTDTCRWQHCRGKKFIIHAPSLNKL
jgi:hypothetical protein